MRLRFHGAARAELVGATRWYEERREGLGTELHAEVKRALAGIVARPHTWPLLLDPDVRRAVVARFPFVIIYALRGPTVIVVAFAHTSRDPWYWRDRIARPPGRLN